MRKIMLLFENKIDRLVKKNADNIMAEIDRQIKKSKEQIKLEKDYYNSIGADKE